MDNSRNTAIERLRSANPHFDLTDNAHQMNLLALADSLLKLNTLSVQDYQELAREFSAPLEFQLAIKLVESRRQVLAINKPTNIGVVFAMWGEHNRLNPKSSENPNGEDSLRMKVAQLQWVTKNSQVSWQLYAVDDGCPHGSANIAQNIAEQYVVEVSKNIHVFSLSDELPAASGPLQHLASADDSRKGGAIILGCQKALEHGCEAVIYTDADNSVHLGQIGLLLNQYVQSGHQVVLGNRKHPDSILVKQEERWGVGIKTLRHMQRMIGVQIFDQGIKDTQAAFKLYGKDVLVRILAAPSVYDFSFDTDWIYAAMQLKQPIATVPFAFIDSAAESASIVQGPMTTWYVLIDGLVKAAKAREAQYSEAMAAVFTHEVQSHKDLELIIDILPPELASASDKELGDPKVMSPEAVRNWIVSAKALNKQLESDVV